MNGVWSLLTEFPAIADLLVAVLGLCVGSFLTVVVYRLPAMLEAEWAGQAPTLSLVSPRSHCPSCQHTLTWWENIPVFSYLCVLRGKCRHCGVRISGLYPGLEAVTAALSVLTVATLGLGWAAAAALLLVWALLALTWIDAREQLLPDAITLPLLWLGLLVNIAGTFVALEDAVLGAVLGYGVLWAIYWVFKWLTGKEGMGHGDFKLLAALGAWMGWAAVPWVVFVGALLGSVFGLAQVAWRRRDFQKPMAFGPFLAIAAWVLLLWGRGTVY